MLQIYIDQYKKAIAISDKRTARCIEKELAALGMDLATLKTIVASTK